MKDTVMFSFAIKKSNLTAVELQKHIYVRIIESCIGSLPTNTDDDIWSRVSGLFLFDNVYMFIHYKKYSQIKMLLNIKSFCIY